MRVEFSVIIRLKCLAIAALILQSINDTNGHIIGDELLEAVGQVIRNAFRCFGLVLEAECLCWAMRVFAFNLYVGGLFGMV